MPNPKPPFGPDPGERTIFSEVSFTETTQVFRQDNLPEPYRQMVEKLAHHNGGPQDETAMLADFRQSAFAEVEMMQRATMIVDTVRSAEASGNWDSARPYLSTRFFGRWQPWAASVRQSGVRGAMNLQRQISQGGIENLPGHDRTTLRVAETDASSGKPPVVTCWTFLRGVANPGVDVAGICTNCGAPVDPTKQSACRYCGAGIAALAPEWILDDVSVDQGASAAPAA